MKYYIKGINKYNERLENFPGYGTQEEMEIHINKLMQTHMHMHTQKIQVK